MYAVSKMSFLKINICFLHCVQFKSIHQGKSVISQVAFALAVAEESLQFEHRDLHWGNVLVRPTTKEEVTFRVLGNTINVPTMGIEANVIDFTMSRLTKGRGRNLEWKHSCGTFPFNHIANLVY